MSDYETNTVDDLPLFRSSDPETSKQAARKMQSTSTAQRHRAEAYLIIKNNPGIIGEKLDELGGVTDRRYSKRVGELKAVRLIESGKPRKNSKGNNCETLWPFGKVPFHMQKEHR